MKKWRIILSSILVCIAAAACGTAIGCKKHSHTYKWEYDDSMHWRVATCGHDIEPNSYAEHTPDAEYKKCKVCGMELTIAGIAVEKTETEYVLNGSATMSISTDDISVKYITKGGIVLKELSSDEYSFTYYKENTEVNNLTSVTSGSYNIWAKTEVDGKQKESFVVVYVLDNVTNFKRSGSFTTVQSLGLDEMSPTWNFSVTYSSGRTETINVTDERIYRSNFTTFVAGDKQAEVTFSERNCKGDLFTKSVNVSYTIGAAAGNVTIDQYSFTALKSALPADKQDEGTVALTSGDFTGTNAFLSVVEGSLVNYRGPSNNVLEIRGDALTVTFDGIGVLEIGARSTSNSNISSLALKDEEGNLIAATYPTSSATIKKDDNRNLYWLTGSSGANTLTFNIVKAGTYTICSEDEVLIGGDIVNTGRNTRIESIKKTDVKEAN